MEYLEFELKINRLDDLKLMIEVVSSPAGNTKVVSLLPYQNIDSIYQTLDVLNEAVAIRGKRDDVEKSGQILFWSLFAGEIYNLYKISRQIADHQKRLLIVKLHLTDNLLASLPWEIIYDPYTREYMYFNTPITRNFYFQDKRLSNPTINLPIRILGVSPSPNDYPFINSDEEEAIITKAIKPLEENGLATIKWLKLGRWKDLIEALSTEEWHILHYAGFSGYQSDKEQKFFGQQFLVFEEDSDKKETHPIYGAMFANILKNCPSLFLVVLATSGDIRPYRYSSDGTIATHIAKNIPSVVSMHFEITDKMARIFSFGFYEAFAEELVLEKAMIRGKIALQIEGHNEFEWANPTLYNQMSSSIVWNFVNQVKLTMHKTSKPVKKIIDKKNEDLTHNKKIMIESQLKLFVVTSNPREDSKLQLDKEIEYIRRVTRRLGDDIYVNHHRQIYDDEFQELLMIHTPHILHFAGHGGTVKEFEDERGLKVVKVEWNDGSLTPPLSGVYFETRPPNVKYRIYPPEALLGIFKSFRDIGENIKVVLLNACWAAGQADILVKSGLVDIAIAMSAPIGDDAAIYFATGFYQSLSLRKYSIQECMEGAKNYMRSQIKGYDEVPVLMVAPGIDPSKYYLF